eukprot:1086813-Pyramimonas_sp.AAC.1
MHPISRRRAGHSEAHDCPQAVSQPKAAPPKAHPGAGRDSMPGCMSLQLVSMRWDSTICRFCVLHSVFGS